MTTLVDIMSPILVGVLTVPAIKDGEPYLAPPVSGDDADMLTFVSWLVAMMPAGLVAASEYFGHIGKDDPDLPNQQSMLTFGVAASGIISLGTGIQGLEAGDEPSGWDYSDVILNSIPAIIGLASTEPPQSHRESLRLRRRRPHPRRRPRRFHRPFICCLTNTSKTRHRQQQSPHTSPEHRDPQAPHRTLTKGPAMTNPVQTITGPSPDRRLRILRYLIAVPVLALLIAMSACASTSPNTPTPSSTSTTDTPASKADCSPDAILRALPDSATMIKFECARAGDTDWAAAQVNPGTTVFFLQWNGTTWDAEDSDSVCGTASAGLPERLLAYCQAPSATTSPAPSTTPTSSKPVTAQCTENAILAALPKHRPWRSSPAPT